jgi:hypothetical protein
MLLSAICSKHRQIIIEFNDKELNDKWQGFKHEFQFHFLDLIPLIRDECLNDSIKQLIQDASMKQKEKEFESFWKNSYLSIVNKKETDL